VDTANLRFRLLMCHKDTSELKNSYILKYIHWGEKQGFNKRPSTRGRTRWWDLGKRKQARLNLNYLINDVGITFIGEIFVSDNFHEIHTEAPLDIFLNSSIFWLFQNLSGRTSFGGGLLKIQTYELEKVFVLPIESDASFSVFSRPPKNIFEEIGINPNQSIREQIPKPLPDRKTLDDIVFDALGLSQEERNEVYWSLCELVKNRLEKAKSV